MGGCDNRRPMPLRAAVSFLPRLYARARDVDLFGTAASLSYTTLLGLVPLATVAIVGWTYEYYRNNFAR